MYIFIFLKYYLTFPPGISFTHYLGHLLFNFDSECERCVYFGQEERLWITRVPGMPLMDKTERFERGTYYCFDPSNWRKVAKEMFVEYEKLEDRPRDLQMPAGMQPASQGV